jgi:photosystem II stability/assembly factor-like uncharacterized protein
MKTNFRMRRILTMGGKSKRNSFHIFIYGVLFISLSFFPIQKRNASAKTENMIRDDILSLSFPTEMEGWASGRYGTILHTSDGGATWIRQESGAQHTLASIFFTDPEHGWAVGVKGTIVHTSDGGKNWIKQESPVDYYHMGIFFINPQKGWIASERTHILTTDDGGKTWQIQFKDEDFVLKSISFADGQHGWTVGEFGYTYYTSDGGQTWEKQAGFYDLDEETGELVGDPSLFGVTAIDPQTAWAVGMDGHVVKTENAGKSWIKVDTGAPNTPLYDVDSDRKDTIVITGKGGCFYSNDLGNVWKQAKFEPTVAYSWMYVVARRGNTSKFAAAGELGAIYRSNSQDLWKRVAY